MEKIPNVPSQSHMDKLSGDNFQGINNEVKWNPLKVILITVLLGGLYLGVLMAAFSTGIKMLIALTIAIPISLAAFIGLLQWFNRNYG
jgi:ABC-type phosphate transport system permease subunit